MSDQADRRTPAGIDLDLLRALRDHRPLSPKYDREAYRAALTCAHDAGIVPPGELPDMRSVLNWIGDALGPLGAPPVMSSHAGRVKARAWVAAILARRIITGSMVSMEALDEALAHIGAQPGAIHWRDTEPDSTDMEAKS